MRSYRTWTKPEERALTEIAHLGVMHAATALDRSVDSIKSKASELGVSLEVRTGVIDATKMTPQVMERIRQMVEASTCPSCGRRPASVVATGLCGVCHYERVVEMKREQLEVEAARRRLEVIRQRRHRMRICLSCGTDFYPRTSSTATVCPGCSS